MQKCAAGTIQAVSQSVTGSEGKCCPSKSQNWSKSIVQSDTFLNVSFFKIYFIFSWLTVEILSWATKHECLLLFGTSYQQIYQEVSNFSNISASPTSFGFVNVHVCARRNNRISNGTWRIPTLLSRLCVGRSALQGCDRQREGREQAPSSVMHFPFDSAAATESYFPAFLRFVLRSAAECVGEHS